METQGVASGPRERLLAAVMDHVVAHGLGDLSLRELAAAIGTSHRMLIYHFGSKEGLVVEVVRAVEAAQQALLTELTADPDLSPEDTARLMWRRFIDPGLRPHERLFFEVYGQALQGRPGTVQLLDGDVDGWVDRIVAGAGLAGLSADEARIEARLAVAVCRGLLLDLLATGDEVAVTRSFERYLAHLRPPDGARST